ncbi:MAG: MFS transporter [Acidimicrobiales bacterium]
MTTTFDALSPAERGVLQRRTLFSLVGGVLPGGGALTAAVAANALLGEEITGRASLGTLAAAFLTIGGTLATTPLASYTSRHGRRRGLRLGWAIGFLGAISAFLAAAFGLYPFLLIGTLAMGAGQAANLSARYAAADLADETNRAKQIGKLVWTSSFSSALGPTIALGAMSAFAVWLGLNEYAGPYLMGIVLFAVAAFMVDRTLRPDPLEVIGGLLPPDADAPTGIGAIRAQFVRAGVGIRKIFVLPAARLAMVSMLVGQAVMVGVMTATPLHMKSGAHEIRVIGFVISVHIIGMYFLSPIVGWLVDRFGSRPVIAAGGVILFIGSEMASHTRAEDSLGVFVGLFLVGVGWSFGLIAGSSLLTSSFTVAERVPIQGAADLVMSGAGAIAALSAGVVYEFGSYHALSHYAGLAAVGMAAYAVWRILRSRDPQTAVAV